MQQMSSKKCERRKAGWNITDLSCMSCGGDGIITQDIICYVCYGTGVQPIYTNRGEHATQPESSATV